MPPATRRDLIVDFVATAGQARATQIAAHLGVAVSLIGGHLRALVRQGRLIRLSRGLYAPAGHDLTGGIMPNGDRKDAREAMQLKEDWEPKGWDTGWAGGAWWALPTTNDGGPVGPAATPGELDAMLWKLEPVRPEGPHARRTGG